jgi:hypothetical protein
MIDLIDRKGRNMPELERTMQGRVVELIQLQARKNPLMGKHEVISQVNKMLGYSTSLHTVLSRSRKVGSVVDDGPNYRVTIDPRKPFEEFYLKFTGVKYTPSKGNSKMGKSLILEEEQEVEPEAEPKVELQVQTEVPPATPQTIDPIIPETKGAERRLYQTLRGVDHKLLDVFKEQISKAGTQLIEEVNVAIGGYERLQDFSAKLLGKLTEMETALLIMHEELAALKADAAAFLSHEDNDVEVQPYSPLIEAGVEAEEDTTLIISEMLIDGGDPPSVDTEVSQSPLL